MSFNLRSWSVIIPAAGRGSRLGFHQPKVLYPIAGRPILAWLADLFAPRVAEAVLVLSPSGAPIVQAALPGLWPGPVRIVLQHQPTGMGDAVALGAAAVSTLHTAIVWGDQAALEPSSIDAVFAAHEDTNSPAITCPTLIRPNPYIHFVRDSTGTLSAVLQAREGDSMPPEGESDTGFFAFSTAALRALLAQQPPPAAAVGARTGEFNLLPLIPLAAQNGITVSTPHVVSLEETIGVNTADDALLIEKRLQQRAQCQL